MRAPLPVLLLCLFLAACTGRAARTAPPSPEGEQARAVPAESLQSLLLRARAATSFNEDLLYTPPPESALGQYAFQLTREPATLVLFENASAFQATDESLAVALADGTLRLFGDPSCGALALPGGPSPLVSWLPGSRWLAATDAARSRLLVGDTASCSLAAQQTLDGEVRALAVAPGGQWLAAADSAGNLWAGTPPRALARAARLGSPCLALGFTEGGGVLLAASEDGSVLLLAPGKNQTLDGFRVPGGPFASARFTDGHVEFTGPSGSTSAFDLATRAPAGLERRETGFHLADGLLTYRTWYNVPQQRLLPGAVRLGLERSPSTGLYRVLEPDGSQRCYEGATLRQTPCVAASDWVAEPLDQDAGFCRKGRCLTLADRVFQVEHARLLCRFVPGKGFYLWWIRAERPNSGNPLQGHLPVRQTLDPGETVPWIPLNPPKDLP